MRAGSEENEEERHLGVETSKRKWEKEWNKYTKQRRRWCRNEMWKRKQKYGKIEKKDGIDPRRELTWR